VRSFYKLCGCFISRAAGLQAVPRNYKSSGRITSCGWRFQVVEGDNRSLTGKISRRAQIWMAEARLQPSLPLRGCSDPPSMLGRRATNVVSSNSGIVVTPPSKLFGNPLLGDFSDGKNTLQTEFGFLRRKNPWREGKHTGRCSHVAVRRRGGVNSQNWPGSLRDFAYPRRRTATWLL